MFSKNSIKGNKKRSVAERVERITLSKIRNQRMGGHETYIESFHRMSEGMDV